MKICYFIETSQQGEICEAEAYGFETFTHENKSGNLECVPYDF